MKSYSSLSGIVLLSLGALAFTGNTLPERSLNPKFNWDDIKFVYAFGDSYSFVQGTRGAANFSFIGDAQNLSFTPQQLLTTEIIPHNTSSEGSNWLEFLTGCFEGRPSQCSRQLWDFAFAGADIDANLLPRHHPFTVPLVDQVQQWIEYAADVIPHPVGATLTTWWIGINDTGDTVTNATISDFTAFWETEMESYFAAVQAATDRGLRAHLFLNVPPEERAPGSASSLNKAALLKAHIETFNAMLASQISAFEAANPDAIVLTFDAHAWFNKVLDDPAPFGFTNTTGYVYSSFNNVQDKAAVKAVFGNGHSWLFGGCIRPFCTCAAPAGFFWFNTGHPTEHVHALLADAVKAQLQAASK